MVEAYCEDLIIKDQHILRFPYLADPTPIQLTDKLLSGPTISSAVFDTEESRICGEFTLEGFQGLASFIHYSVHSAYRGLTALRLCRDAINWVFQWKQQGTKRPYVKTLIGMTPMDSKGSLRAARALGFVKQFTLPDAIYRAADDTYIDCMISTKVK